MKSKIFSFAKFYATAGLLFLWVASLHANPHKKGQFVITLAPSGTLDQALHDCGATSVKDLGDGLTFLVQASDKTNADGPAAPCTQSPSVATAEPNLILHHPQGLTIQLGLLNQSTVGLLNQSTVALLNDSDTENYYGANVKTCYVEQPGLTLIGNDAAHQLSTGLGVVVADIDNGVDPDNPVLRNVLVPGFNTIDNNQDVSVWSDLNQSTVALLNQNQAMGLDQSTVSLLNQSTVSLLNQSTVSLLNQSMVSLLNQSTVALLNQSMVALLNQSTVALLNQSTVGLLNQSTVALLNQLPADFGHGTMVTGLIHVVAPNAQIMPIKSFGQDGTGTLADVVEGIYYAVGHGADVINMSFSFDSGSRVLQKAIRYAKSNGVILVTSMGNDGDLTRNIYPAAYGGVYGIAATDDNDVVAPFTNYGPEVAFDAPGVELVTLFPGGHYALVSGTSFSSAIFSGLAALSGSLLHSDAQRITGAIGQGAVNISNKPANHPWRGKIGKGRVDALATLQHLARH